MPSLTGKLQGFNDLRPWNLRYLVIMPFMQNTEEMADAILGRNLSATIKINSVGVNITVNRAKNGVSHLEVKFSQDLFPSPTAGYISRGENFVIRTETLRFKIVKGGM